MYGHDKRPSIKYRIRNVEILSDVKIQTNKPIAESFSEQDNGDNAKIPGKKAWDTHKLLAVVLKKYWRENQHVVKAWSSSVLNLHSEVSLQPAGR